MRRLKVMEFKSEQKYIRISPKKVRPILREIKKLSVSQALLTLPFVGKRGAVVVEKVIKSAVANARQKGVEVENLKIKEIIANAGPALKRGRPVSRGQWHPIKKRMTHLKVVLSAETKEKEEVKEKVGKSSSSKVATEVKVGTNNKSESKEDKKPKMKKVFKSQSKS